MSRLRHFDAFQRLSQSNAMYNFAQFVYYVIFGWNKPNAIRQDDEQIFDVIENIDRFLKKAETDMGGYKLVLEQSGAPLSETRPEKPLTQTFFKPLWESTSQS
jgi:hypothetical protein